MQFLKKNTGILLAFLVYLAISLFLIWKHQEVLVLFPIGLLLIYFTIFHTEETLITLGLLTPLSINIEEYTESFGLFIPTEPILFGMMLLFLWIQLTKKNLIPIEAKRHPIIISVSFYLIWILITSITSTDIIVSIKFLVAKLWFIIPILFFGIKIYSKPKNIKTFIWLYLIGISIVILYTLAHHSMYSFGEKEGHWVMWPFYKDHTIYGMAIALAVPLVFGLLFSKEHQLLTKAIILTMAIIIITGLYFSYTRAAWLSVVGAIGVWILIRLRIKFSILLTTSIFIIGTIFIFWDNIQMELARNNAEHTTENFNEKLQSATNITTDASNLERINRWACAYDMFLERPVFGFGPGRYAFEYARFQRPENLTIISTNFGDLGNAHSEFLGALSEMGLIGMLSFIAIVASIFYTGIHLFLKWPSLKEEDKEIRTLILAMILSLVTYFTHGFLNNYLDTDKASIPIWTFCATFIGLEIMLKQQTKNEFNASSNAL